MVWKTYTPALLSFGNAGETASCDKYDHTLYAGYNFSNFDINHTISLLLLRFGTL